MPVELTLKKIPYYVELRGFFVQFINKFATLAKRREFVLKYLFNLQNFYAITIITYGLSKCSRFF